MCKKTPAKCILTILLGDKSLDGVIKKYLIEPVALYKHMACKYLKTIIKELIFYFNVIGSVQGHLIG